MRRCVRNYGAKRLEMSSEQIRGGLMKPYRCALPLRKATNTGSFLANRRRYRASRAAPERVSGPFLKVNSTPRISDLRPRRPTPAWSPLDVEDSRRSGQKNIMIPVVLLIDPRAGPNAFERSEKVASRSMRCACAPPRARRTLRGVMESGAGGRAGRLSPSSRIARVGKNARVEDMGP
jgi:hypothetical protein